MAQSIHVSPLQVVLDSVLKTAALDHRHFELKMAQLARATHAIYVGGINTPEMISEQLSTLVAQLAASIAEDVQAEDNDYMAKVTNGKIIVPLTVALALAQYGIDLKIRRANPTTAPTRYSEQDVLLLAIDTAVHKLGDIVLAMEAIGNEDGSIDMEECEGAARGNLKLATADITILAG